MGGKQYILRRPFRYNTPSYLVESLATRSRYKTVDEIHEAKKFGTKAEAIFVMTYLADNFKVWISKKNPLELMEVPDELRS